MVKLGNFAVQIIATSLGSFGGILGIFLPLYFIEVGGTTLTFGLASSVSLFCGIVFIFLGGVFCDRFGRKILIVMGNLLSLGTTALYLWSQDWFSVALVIVLTSLANIGSLAGRAIIIDSVKPERRTRGIASYQVVSTLPGIAAPLLGGYLMKVYGLLEGFRLSIFLALIGSALVVAIQALLLKETLEKKTKGARPYPIGNFKKDISLLPVSLKYLWIILILVILANALVGPYYIIYANKVVGIDVFQWGIIVTLQIIVGNVAKLLGSIVTDKIGKKLIMVISVGLSAPLPIFFFLAGSFTEILIVSLVMVLVGMYYLPAQEALQMDFTKKELRGRVLVVSDMFSGLSRGLGLAIGGALFALEAAYPFFAFFFLEAIAVFILIFFVKEPEVKEI